MTVLSTVSQQTVYSPTLSTRLAVTVMHCAGRQKFLDEAKDGVTHFSLRSSARTGQLPEKRCDFLQNFSEVPQENFVEMRVGQLAWTNQHI